MRQFISKTKQGTRVRTSVCDVCVCAIALRVADGVSRAACSNSINALLMTDAQCTCSAAP